MDTAFCPVSDRPYPLRPSLGQPSYLLKLCEGRLTDMRRIITAVAALAALVLGAGAGTSGY